MFPLLTVDQSVVLTLALVLLSSGFITAGVWGALFRSAP